MLSGLSGLQTQLFFLSLVEGLAVGTGPGYGALGSWEQCLHHFCFGSISSSARLQKGGATPAGMIFKPLS